MLALKYILKIASGLGSKVAKRDFLKSKDFSIISRKENI